MYPLLRLLALQCSSQHMPELCRSQCTALLMRLCSGICSMLQAAVKRRQQSTIIGTVVLLTHESPEES